MLNMEKVEMRDETWTETEISVKTLTYTTIQRHKVNEEQLTDVAEKIIRYT